MRARWLVGSVVFTMTAFSLFAACGDSTFESDNGDGAAESAVSGDGATADAIPGDEIAINGDAARDSGCGGSHGPDMIPIPSTNYCVDATEVSRAQYQEFIQAIALGYTAPSAPHCAWNSTFVIPSACLAAAGDGGDLPVTCVDWCDAVSFCEWAGKRLCGRAAGGSLTVAQGASADSEWITACNAHSTRAFAYASDYTKGECNVDEPDGGTALAVVGPSAFPNCVGGYPELRDLPGNASEWINACDDGPDASDAAFVNCVKIGGSVAHAGKSPPGRCDDFDFTERSQKYADVGFRCCSDDSH